MNYETIVSNKVKRYEEAGLTPQEIELITTPVSALSPQAKAIGFAVLDKYTEYVRKNNEEYKLKEREEKLKQPFHEQIGTPTIKAKTVL